MAKNKPPNPDQVGSGPSVMPDEPKPDDLTIDQQIAALERHAKTLEEGRLSIRDLGRVLEEFSPLLGVLPAPQAALAQAAFSRLGKALKKRF